MAISYVVDDRLADDVRTVMVFAPADAGLRPAEVAADIRRARDIPATQECRAEGKPAPGGAERVHVSTRPVPAG